MRIILIMIIGLMLSNCTNSSYVKNKKTITSPDDLQKFINVYCNKNKQTDKVIKVCGNGWSKDLNISENKAIFSAKIWRGNGREFVLKTTISGCEPDPAFVG